MSLENRFAPFFKKSATSKAANAFCLNVFCCVFIMASLLLKRVNFSLTRVGVFTFMFGLL